MTDKTQSPFAGDPRTFTDNPGYIGTAMSGARNDFTARFVTAKDAASTEYIIRADREQLLKLRPFIAEVVTGGPGMMLAKLKEGVNLRDMWDICGDDRSAVGPNRRAVLA